MLTTKISDVEYHADKAWLSSSQLRDFIESPLAYKYYLMNPKKQTDSMIFGSACHLINLQQEEIGQRLVKKQIFEGTGSRKARDEWKATIPKDSLILDEEDMDKVFKVYENVMRHKNATRYIITHDHEVTGYWKDEVTGIECKLRADLFHDGVMSLMDYKTTSRGIDKKSFRYEILDRMYHVQLGFYALGIKAITGKDVKYAGFIVSDTNAPFECRVYIDETGLLEEGKAKAREALDRLAVCIKEDKWPQGQIEQEGI